VNRPVRIVLFHEGGSFAVDPVLSLFADFGFEVRPVRVFLDLLQALMSGGADLILFYLPEKAGDRYAILTEARNASPHVPIVAMTPTLLRHPAQFLEQFRVSHLLPSGANHLTIVDTVRKTLASNPDENRR